MERYKDIELELVEFVLDDVIAGSGQSGSKPIVSPEIPFEDDEG